MGVVNITPQPFMRGKGHGYPFDKRLSGRLAEEKNVNFSRIRTPDFCARSLVAISTTLSLLLNLLHRPRLFKTVVPL
jgi:hypothetical protein